MTGIRRFDRDKDRRIIAVAAPPPPPIALPPSKSRDDLELRSWFECFNERAPKQVLAGGIVKGNRTFLAGKPGVGKTWVAAWIAFQVARGSRFGRGDQNPPPLRVWWLDLEMGENQFLSRFESIVRGIWPTGGFPKQDELGLFFDTDKRLNLDTDEGMVKLIEFLVANDIDVLFIDSFAKVTAGRENEKTDMQPVMDRVTELHRQLTERRGVPFTSVIIGHETKTGDGTVAGSRVMWAEPDTLLFLREGPTKKERVLKTKKNRNDKEYEISYSVNWGEDRSGRDAFWINDDREVGGDGETIAPQPPKHSPIRDSLVDMLRNGRAMTATDIKKRAELEGKNIFPAQLKKYVDDGTLTFDAASKLYKLA